MVALTSMPEARINGREVAGCIFWDEQQKRLSINDSNRRSPGVSRGRCHMSAWNVTAPPQPPTTQHRETFLKLLPEIPLRIKLNTYLLSFLIVHFSYLCRSCFHFYPPIECRFSNNSPKIQSKKGARRRTYQFSIFSLFFDRDKATLDRTQCGIQRERSLARRFAR